MTNTTGNRNNTPAIPGFATVCVLSLNGLSLALGLLRLRLNVG
ncbi:hypothetical protein [Parasutterella excrementihominis]|nr:hypothetical protein [Parasutterella excrementihominis]